MAGPRITASTFYNIGYRKNNRSAFAKDWEEIGRYLDHFDTDFSGDLTLAVHLKRHCCMNLKNRF